MVRIAWVVAPGGPHHVTQRGNRRQKVFFCDDDYGAYCVILAEGCRNRAGEIVLGRVMYSVPKTLRKRSRIHRGQHSTSGELATLSANGHSFDLPWQPRRTNLPTRRGTTTCRATIYADLNDRV